MGGSKILATIEQERVVINIIEGDESWTDGSLGSKRGSNNRIEGSVLGV